MQKIILTISIIFISTLCYSQNWVNSAGGNFNDESYDVEVDAAGNIYSTGYTTAASVFGPTISLTTNGYSDIYVSKSDPNGNFLWTKVFGGAQADRGYDIAIDPTGNIYVTGYYQGTASFDNTTLTSINNSQDIFVLKLDNNGNLLWVKSEGGAEGDTGYGITFDNLGNVITTGQFKGNAQIGINNFSSTIDPNTGLPAYDMFISKYDANGNNLWSLQGIAKYDDRGLAVTTDLNNNIYLTGQFSDTLTIAGVQHNNTIFNAGMLLKLDPTGNELWFKRMGAVQTLVYDIEIDDTGNAYITGDFLGQMIIIGSSGNNYLNGNYTYRIFLIKFSPNGEVLWMRVDDSNSEVSSKAITLDANQDPYLTGTFKCVFDEYADSLGAGLFNSVGYNDLFITKYDNNGTQQWMKQYGGPLDDYCSGIAISQINNPIISGGYTEYFNYPIGTNFLPFPSGINKIFPPYTWQNNCNTAPYMYLNSVGAKDIVIAKPVDLSTPHYFYYENTACYNDKLPCIENLCPDSLVFCGNGTINDDTHTAGNGFYQENYNAFPTNYHHAPYFDFLWSNGDTTSYSNITTTGNYWIKTERIDGCLVTNDTVFVTINPIPSMPHLTDDHGFNNQQYPVYHNIILCAPDTATTSFGDLDTNLLFTYTTPLGTIYTDSLPHSIYEEGAYSVNVIDSNNCSASSFFNLYYIINSKDTIVPYIIAPNDTVCSGESVCYVIADSITNPTGIYSPYCDSNIYSPNIQCLEFCFIPVASGWHPLNHEIILGYDNMCGIDTTHYFVQDSMYIEVLPKPTLALNLSGDPLLCPGDTINVWTDSLVAGFSWSGPGILTINGTGDTIFANQQGNYTYSGTITDTLTGCSTSISQSFYVAVKPSPTIISNVPDNIICPGDSILLTCLQAGVNYDWIGPQGNSIGSNQTIWVNVPGFYHCVLTDFDGCILTSNSIEVKEYNTPYLLADPGTELCHTGAIELTAIYSGLPTFQWLPPINSTNPSVIVNQPGTYYLEVIQCGFTVTDSVTITSANIPAAITPLTDTIICPGDTAILIANSGMGAYEWSPIQFFGQMILITDTGNYYVTVTDGSTGCTAVSDTIHIGFYAGGIPPSIQNQTICYGDSTSLINLNSNLTTSWFQDSTNSIPFFIGDSITLHNIINDTIVYVENFDSNCTSKRIPVNISISQASFTPSIIGNDSICLGDSISLYTSTIPNGSYYWNGPNGFTSNQNPLIISNVDTNNAGTYTLSISDNNCSSNDTNINITILPLPQISINAPDTLWKCYSDTLSIHATGNYQNIIWNTNSILDSTKVFNPGTYYAFATGANSCSISSDTIFVMNYTIQNPTVTDTTICFGDSVALSSLNNLTLNWHDSTLTLLTIDSVYQTSALYNSIYYITTFTDSNGCQSPSQIINVYVTPANGSPNIFGDTIICEGQSLFLNTNNLTGASYQWSNSSGTISNNISYSNPSVSLADSGYYFLTVNGVPCINSQKSVHITVNPTPQPPSILGDTVYCSNDTLSLYSNNTNDTLIWLDTQFNSYYQDSLVLTNLTNLNSGNYYLSYIDSNGCISLPDTININILNPPLIPNIYNNPSYCSGDSANIFTDSLVGLTYQWDGPNLFTSSSPNNWINNIQSINSGNYNLLITDSNGCTENNTTTIQVFDYPIINLGSDTLLCLSSLPFTLETDTFYSDYLWQDGYTGYSYNILDSGLYHVTVSNGGICSASDSIYIQTSNCLINNLSNIITPNGDGINDYFTIKNLEYYPNSKLEIFNRWGKLIFSSNNYQNNWNGEKQNPGTYYYIFYPNSTSTESNIEKGFITLLKQ